MTQVSDTYAYVALKMQFEPDPLVAYIVVGVFMVILVVTTCCILKKEINQISILRFVRNTIIPIVVITSISIFITYIICDGVKMEAMHFVAFTLGYSVISVLLYGAYLLFLMDKETRKLIVNKYLKKRI